MITNHLMGLHLRIETNYEDLARQARSLNINTVQFFLIPHKKKRYAIPESDDRERYKKHQENFAHVFVHLSYWINLASPRKNVVDVSKRLLRHEIEIGTSLGITNFVLHPGSTKGLPRTQESKIKGIEQLALHLDTITAEFPQIKILIENNAHGGMTLGSNLNDFIILREKLTTHSVYFCFDTAHAYAYGYSFTNTEDFISLLDKTMGIDGIKLIHFNDTCEKLGSKKDVHALPGQGIIGKDNLKRFIQHEKIKTIPLIMELPYMSTEELRNHLNNVKTW